MDKASPSSTVPTPEHAERLDGRVRRGERNRKKILDAVYELVRSGVVRPTAEMVANHAAVGDRTVFRHFQDMEQLHDGLHQRVAAEVLEIVADQTRPAGDLASRIRAIVRLRGRIFEHIAPFRRTARAFAGTPAVTGEPHADLDKRMRNDLHQLLAPEIEDVGKELLEALDALLSFETWDRLRSNQRLSPAQATRAMEAGALALLRGA